MGKTLETRNRWVLDRIGVRDCKGEQKLWEWWSLKSRWWCLLPNRMQLSKLLEKCTIQLDLMYANCTSIKRGESLRDWSFLAVNTLVSSLLKTSVSKHLSCWENTCGFLFSFPKRWKPSSLESNFSRSGSSSAHRETNIQLNHLSFLGLTVAILSVYNLGLMVFISPGSKLKEFCCWVLLSTHLWEIYIQKCIINKRCSWIWTFLLSYWFHF